MIEINRLIHPGQRNLVMYVVINKEQRSAMKRVKKDYGHISVSWIQYKFHVSLKEAEKILEEFNDKTRSS